jgi:hypothetical protein
LLALEFGCFSGEAAITRCYGARRGTGNYYQLHMRDTTAPSELCRSMDTNVLLATCNQVGRHGLYPGHYSRMFIAPRMHKMQKPSVGQGLYPILLLALSASTTSAFTSLGVSQESSPDLSYLKRQSNHSATSAVLPSIASGARMQMGPIPPTIPSSVVGLRRTARQRTSLLSPSTPQRSPGKRRVAEIPVRWLI